MAKAKDIKDLIGSYGRPEAFRSAALKLIAGSGKGRNAKTTDDLKALLDTTVTAAPASSKSLQSLAELADPSDELLEATEPRRDRHQIVLSDESRALIDGLLDEHRRGDELRRHRLPIRSKVLFCGPPGCGKTLAAEVVAKELALPLFTLKLDVVISSYLGETATNLRRVFEIAARRPCVLFLDEFDTLARSRSDHAEHNELRRVVNSLLMFIDRFVGRGLLVAATNLEGSIDPAVWRRFDEVVLFEPPSADEVGSMLALRFKNYPVNFDVSKQASKLSGLSFAEIERICYDAIKRSVLKKNRCVDEGKGVSETEFAAAMKSAQRRQAIAKRLQKSR